MKEEKNTMDDRVLFLESLNKLVELSKKKDGKLDFSDINEQFKDIDLDDFTESVPAFICIIMIPMAYSISDGIVLGLISYVLTNLLSGKFKKISLTMYILAALFTLKYLV